MNPLFWYGGVGAGFSSGVLVSNYGVLFDLDGTLVDSLSDICGNLNRVREYYGLEPLPDCHLARFIGKGVEHLIHGGFKEMPEELMPEVILRYRDFYLDTPRIGGNLYPGVRETLERLRAEPSFKLAIVTNKASLLAEKTVECYLPDFDFDFIAGPDRVTHKKPNPLHILEVLPKLGLDKRNTWFIGDDPVDAECARASGVRFLAAGWGFGGVSVPADSRLDAFPDLLKKIPLC